MTVVGDGPLKADLEKEIYRLGLYDKIELLGAKSEEEVGKLLWNQILCFYRHCCIKWRQRWNSQCYSRGNVGGIANLASCYAGASEAFIDGVSGFSLNPKEPYTWVELIEDFAQNPLKYEKIRKKAIEVRERFNINQTARKLIQNFEQIALLDENSS